MGLTASIFDNCNLEDAYFDQTILPKVDFTTSYGYVFNPNSNKIGGATFAVDGLAGLLGQYNIKVRF